MKAVYPIVITPPKKEGEFYLIYIPDFDTNTEGTSLGDALYMARDAIGLLGICLEDEGKEIPAPSTYKPQAADNELVALVDVDFTAYREKEDNKAVRKNCTIPAWLNRRAEAQHVNFSATLQQALLAIVGK